MFDHKMSRENEILDAHTKMISPHCALHCHVKACKGMLCIWQCTQKLDISVKDSNWSRYLIHTWIVSGPSVNIPPIRYQVKKFLKRSNTVVCIIDRMKFFFKILKKPSIAQKKSYLIWKPLVFALIKTNCICELKTS